MVWQCSMTSDPSVPKSEGLPPAQIRALLALREESVELLGATFEVDPRRIPETINRRRRNEPIRLKLCAHLNLPYEKLWGDPTDPKPNSEAKAA